METLRGFLKKLHSDSRMVIHLPMVKATGFPMVTLMAIQTETQMDSLKHSDLMKVIRSVIHLDFRLAIHL